MQRKYHAGYELISNIVRGDFGSLDVTFKQKLNLKKNKNKKKTTNCVGGKSVSVVAVHSLPKFQFLHSLRTKCIYSSISGSDYLGSE